MPVFPWRFIDSLLGRSRPGDDEIATEENVAAEAARLSERLESEAASLEHLDDTAKVALSEWAAGMLRRRAPVVDGRSRRDMHVQLGAVSGAVRAVMRALDEAFAKIDDALGQRLAWRLRSVESEIASPLYLQQEQAVVRTRVDRLLEQLDRSQHEADLGMVIPRLLEALTPPDI